MGYHTLFELWHGRQPIVSHIRPFGTICFAFIPSEKQNKLDNTAIKCRLLECDDDKSTMAIGIGVILVYGRLKESGQVVPIKITNVI